MSEIFAGLDATMLPRIQSDFTITFHVLFLAFSLGLAGFLVTISTSDIRCRIELRLRVIDMHSAPRRMASLSVNM
jgi:hypothetical protein